jgi:hypothetical protein
MSNEETVAVPALRDALQAELGWTEQEIDEFVTERLIPKPKPRLVVVNPEQHADNGYSTYMDNDWLDAQPDLLEVLDDAMRPVMLDDRRKIAMNRIRAALGVTE